MTAGIREYAASRVDVPNAPEDNVTLYCTVNGRRTGKKRADMKVASNQWHTLRVDCQGVHVTLTLDGKKALEWQDETFKDAGKVGVWTKAYLVA